MKNVHVISKERVIIDLIKKSFPAEMQVASSGTIPEALNSFQNTHVDLLFIDIDILEKASETNSIKNTILSFLEFYSSLEIFIMTSHEMLREAVRAVKNGAFGYLTYPLSVDEIKLVSQDVIDQHAVQSELDYLRGHFWDQNILDIVQTESPAMQKVFENVRSVALTRSTVLLTGETGTGKGVLAQLIHRHSNRRDRQFIALHCGAIPDTLIESELFGHEKGSFTGAIKRKIGKFEIANGGTIFLDEIGTITPSVQIKLLQVLQDGFFQRIGGESSISSDTRIIAATNIDLKKHSDDGVFRKDLFYRLNVFPIELPPLRERKEDIPRLVDVFLARLNKKNIKFIKSIHPRVLEAFLAYSWPGNIREMENIIERAHILENSSMLMPESFPEELFGGKTAFVRNGIDMTMTLADVRKHGLENIEKKYLQKILQKFRGRIDKSAKAAGISTRQLHKLMKKYNFRKEDFKNIS